MKATKSFFGTGIRPFYLGCNSSTFLECTCPECKTQGRQIPCLTRDYLSLLGMPVFPLGLSAAARCCSWFRISLSRALKRDLVSHCNSSFRSESNLGWKGTWLVAAAVALVGAALGLLGGWLLSQALSWDQNTSLAAIVLGVLLTMMISNMIFRAGWFKGAGYIMDYA